jgi:hypothetical protein
MVQKPINYLKSSLYSHLDLGFLDIGLESNDVSHHSETYSYEYVRSERLSYWFSERDPRENSTIPPARHQGNTQWLPYLARRGANLQKSATHSYRNEARNKLRSRQNYRAHTLICTGRFSGDSIQVKMIRHASGTRHLQIDCRAAYLNMY